MIIVKIEGGLGNQLFQYALGRHLAIKHKTCLKFDISEFDNKKHLVVRTFELPKFKVNIDIARQEDINRAQNHSPKGRLMEWIYGLFSNEVKIKKEPVYNFAPAVLKYPDNIYLIGYWQSEKYFEGIEKTLRMDLKFSNELSAEQKKLHDKINDCNAVSMHVRRGDFVYNPNDPHTICSVDYYKNAVEVISKKIKNPVFFVFSDGIEWTKKNIDIPYEHYYVSGNEAWVDLKLMSSCKHNIIANSSFSWWGAYLNNYKQKVVICPAVWYKENNDFLVSDLIPEKWNRLLN